MFNEYISLAKMELAVILSLHSCVQETKPPFKKERVLLLLVVGLNVSVNF